MEELLARHRKELRELQGRITNKKKNATKKTRKGVNDECDRLDHELREKHRAEIEALNPGPAGDQASAESDDPLAASNTEPESALQPTKNPTKDELDKPASEEPDGVSEASQSRTKKQNRQKARLARRAAEQEEAAAAAEVEAASMPNRREQEISAMKAEMEKRGLTETMIRPDGHCLFSACAHSMPPGMIKKDGLPTEPYKSVRAAAAGFMLQHSDDFAPFLEEPLQTYAAKIRDTAEWGGQLELQAISRSYSLDINVLQADGRVERITSEPTSGKSAPIWLAYYRHSFGLGEHYNALTQKDTS